MNTNAFMFKALIIFVIVIAIKVIYNIYRDKFFKSATFEKLNRETDNIAEQYEEIEDLSQNIRRELYADFSPMFVEGEIKRSAQRYTYICNEALMERIKADKIAVIKEYCGFTNSIGIKEQLERLQKQLIQLEIQYDKFKIDCEDALKEVEKATPGLIWFLSNKKVLLLLGMQTAGLELSEILPKYVFRSEDRADSITVEVNAKVIEELLN